MALNTVTENKFTTQEYVSVSCSKKKMSFLVHVTFELA
jgi:hypothetical protein